MLHHSSRKIVGQVKYYRAGQNITATYLPADQFLGGSKYYMTPGFEQGFWQDFDNKHVLAVLSIYLGFARRKIEFPTIPQPLLQITDTE